MQLEEFYSQLLELERPWYVEKVVWNAEGRRVDAYVARDAAPALSCPRCGGPAVIAGVGKSQAWRHLDTGGHPTFVHVRAISLHCPDHGKSLLLPSCVEPKSLATSRFRATLKHLSKEMDDSRLAAVFSLSRLQLKEILGPGIRSGRQQVAANPQDPDVSPPSPPIPTQLSIFQNDGSTWINQGLRELKKLNFKAALEAFHKYRAMYPSKKGVDFEIELTRFLEDAFRELPGELATFVDRFCGLWKEVEKLAGPLDHRRASLLSSLEDRFFGKGAEMLDAQGPGEEGSAPSHFPPGYVYLRAGNIDRAIDLLQANIRKTPDNAALYGYLGDAYFLRGREDIARSCYREACLIDPNGIDWELLKDQALRTLVEEIMFEEAADLPLAREWLPSYARTRGLFEPKAIRINAGLKEILDEYLGLKKLLLKEEKPEWSARLFFRGMILCDNEESLRFIRKVEIAEVRRAMKKASPHLFESYMDELA